MICPQCRHENTDDEMADLHETPYLTPSGSVPPPLPRGGFGDILDSTFSVYGKHLLPFILIALLPQIPLLFGSILSLTEIGPAFNIEFPAAEGEEPPEPLSLYMFDMLGGLISIAIGILATAAIIQSVGRHFLGRPVLVQRSYIYAWMRFRKLVVALALVLLILFVPITLSVFIIGIPLLIFAVVVLLFVNHAVAIEQLGPVDAIKRSWNVVQGNWWRTFGTFMAILLAFIGAALVIFIPAGIFLPTFLISLLSAAFSTLVTPIFTIAITVLYFDIRVRKEQYAHNDLAREIGELPRMEAPPGPQYEAGV